MAGQDFASVFRISLKLILRIESKVEARAEKSCTVDYDSNGYILWHTYTVPSNNNCVGIQ